MIQPHTLTLQGHTLIEHRDDTHGSDQATRFLGRALRVAPGAIACEIGCGTGVLAMLAKRLGAARVHACDVDAGALELVRSAARANGLAIETWLGPLLDPVPPHERLDLVIALLPQKPAPSAFDLRYAGGADGTALLCAAIDAAGARLVRGGSLWLYHHSLAAPARVERALDACFRWRVVAERLRCCASAAYAALAPGMLERILELAAAGTAQAWTRGAFLVWRARVIEATR